MKRNSIILLILFPLVCRSPPAVHHSPAAETADAVKTAAEAFSECDGKLVSQEKMG